MALNIDELIKKLQASDTGVTINVINVNGDAAVVDDVVDDIDTDFSVGDRVMVCHIKKDGTSKHTDGTVTEIDSDDYGDYVRVTGDNGCHYKCGTHMDEARKGSKIVRVL